MMLNGKWSSSYQVRQEYQSLEEALDKLNRQVIMHRMELMSDLLGIKCSKFSKTETLILEGDLFTRLCDELKKRFKTKYFRYFQLMKFNAKVEDEMLERNLVRYVIDDILAIGVVNSITMNLGGISSANQTR